MIQRLPQKEEMPFTCKSKWNKFFLNHFQVFVCVMGKPQDDRMAGSHVFGFVISLEQKNVSNTRLKFMLSVWNYTNYPHITFTRGANNSAPLLLELFTELARVQTQVLPLQYSGVLANSPDVEVDENGQSGEGCHSEPGQHEDIGQHDELGKATRAGILDHIIYFFFFNFVNADKFAKHLKVNSPSLPGLLIFFFIQFTPLPGAVFCKTVLSWSLCWWQSYMKLCFMYYAVGGAF